MTKKRKKPRTRRLLLCPLTSVEQWDILVERQQRCERRWRRFGVILGLFILLVTTVNLAAYRANREEELFFLPVAACTFAFVGPFFYNVFIARRRLVAAQRRLLRQRRIFGEDDAVADPAELGAAVDDLVQRLRGRLGSQVERVHVLERAAASAHRLQYSLEDQQEEDTEDAFAERSRLEAFRYALAAIESQALLDRGFPLRTEGTRALEGAVALLEAMEDLEED